MSLVFSRSTKKIVGMQRQARRAVLIAVRLFDTDKKATKLNRARIFTELQVCFSYGDKCSKILIGENFSVPLIYWRKHVSSTNRQENANRQHKDFIDVNRTIIMVQDG
jgi:hypothetical protein